MADESGIEVYRYNYNQRDILIIAKKQNLYGNRSNFRRVDIREWDETPKEMCLLRKIAIFG